MIHNNGDASHPNPKNYALGIGCMLLSSIFLALISACAKLATQSLKVEVVAFYQFALATIIVIPFVFRKGLLLVKTEHPYVHLVRIVSGFFFFFLLYVSLSSILLIDAIVLTNTAPLFVPIVISIWFKQRLNTGILCALFIGFLGIIMILHPGEKGFLKWGAIFGLLSGISGAIGLVAIRKLILTDKADTIMFYYFLCCSIFLVPIIFLFYKWEWPQRNEWWPILGMGAFLPVMQYFQAKANFFAPATRVAPFFYASIIFSGLFGWWIWDEVPSWLSVVGTLFVVMGAIISIFIGRPPTVSKK